jgi:hypothetical protein
MQTLNKMSLELRRDISGSLMSVIEVDPRGVDHY